MPEPGKSKNVVLFTGHLIDAAGRQQKRFPVELMEPARDLIKIYLEEELRLQLPDLAITSLGAGGDMIFADEILKLNIPLIVFLPFEKKRFIQESVSYEKQNLVDDSLKWRDEFERILNLAEKVIYSEVQEPSHSVNPFEECNERMLEYAFRQAVGKRDNISAIALMRPQETLKEGGTSHFVNHLKKQNVSIQVIWPENQKRPNEADMLDSIIPVFAHLDSSAAFHQKKWKQRLIAGLVILALIVFFDEFVNIPDDLFWGYAGIVRTVAVIISMAGVFITLQLQISDKTSFGKWTLDRAKAEQIRSEIWFYLFNISSQNNLSGTYGESEFEKYIDHLKPFIWHGYQINLSRLIGLKQRMLIYNTDEKVDYYKKHRLDDQLNYFKSKHAFFKKRLFLYKLFTYLFLIISITWGTLNIVGEFYLLPSFIVDISPIGMMVGFIALISTYAESNNSKEMEFKYMQMANGLESMAAKCNHILNKTELEVFVKECETYLRTQNNEWSLKRLNQ